MLSEALVLAFAIERTAERLERSNAMLSMQLYKLAMRLADGRVSVEEARVRYDALRPDMGVETDEEDDHGPEDIS